MALAVFGIVVLPWVSERNGHDITAASQGDGSGSGPRPELPDVVELHCSPGAVDVPVASIRPQVDGLHVEIVNDLGVKTWAWVVSASSWDSGRFPVAPGTTEVIVTPPPGPLTIGCTAGVSDQQRQVELVDVNHVYTETGLDCPDAEQAESPEVIPVPRDRSGLPSAARAALGAQVGDSDHIEANSGYREPAYQAKTTEPSVRLVRGDETIAIVHLVGTPADDAAGRKPTPQGPWVSVDLIEYCPAYLEPPTGGDTTPDSRTPA